MDKILTILEGDALEFLMSIPSETVQTCVTSPPYWGLRDYGNERQMGLEATPELYIARMVEVFREVKRVLKNDGTLWVNVGDSFCSTAPGTMGDSLRQEGILSGVSNRRADGSRKFRPETPNGLKPKDLVGIPWMLAFALRADGWWLRSDIVWHKQNPMPESVTDRPTRSHEFIFLLSKSERYFYDFEAIKEPGIYAGPNGDQHSPHAQGFTRRSKKQEKERQDKQRGHGRRHNGFNDRWDQMTKEEQCSVMRNKRDVWTVNTCPFPDAHFATFPEDLIKPCVMAGSRLGDIVLDPFFGSGTTGKVSIELGRRCIGIELNPEYVRMARERCQTTVGML
jgi:DNA modification methylase